MPSGPERRAAGNTVEGPGQVSERDRSDAGDIMNRAFLACAGLIMMLAGSSIAAHHSPVMFDRSVSKTLVGTVVQFTWTNPHSSIQLDVPNESGGVDRWGVELGSPQSMARNGWRSNLLKAGRQSDGGRQSRSRAANSAASSCRSCLPTAEGLAAAPPIDSEGPRAQAPGPSRCCVSLTCLIRWSA
jgi:hypothetical protein